MIGRSKRKKMTCLDCKKVDWMPPQSLRCRLCASAHAALLVARKRKARTQEERARVSSVQKEYQARTKEAREAVAVVDAGILLETREQMKRLKLEHEARRLAWASRPKTKCRIVTLSINEGVKYCP